MADAIDPTDPNIGHWETLARFHGTGHDDLYDVEALVAGRYVIADLEADALDRATHSRGVDGLDVIHIQSHIGFDSVAMARGGARVTAVDFSPTALERLAAIAQRCGVAVRTVRSDARDLPRELDDSFDLAYATIGVLGWIDDLDRWMASAARVVRDDGRLVVVEIHPLQNVFSSVNPPVADFAYGGGVAITETSQGSYANVEAPFTTSTTEYAHSLGDVVTAALGAGFEVETLIEHESMSFDPRGGIFDHDSDGRYRLRVGVGADGTRASAAALPVAYTLISRRSRRGARPSPRP